MIGIKQAGGPELPSEAILDHNCRAGDQSAWVHGNWYSRRRVNHGTDLLGIFYPRVRQWTGNRNTRVNKTSVLISCALQCHSSARSGHSISRKTSHTLNSIHPVGAVMQREELIRDGLLLALSQRYRDNPSQFLTLSRQSLDSALMRGVVTDLRNEGQIEEQMRGVIRLTPRGYRTFRNDPLPYW